MSRQEHPPRKRRPVSAAGLAHLRTDRLDEREREADRREALADEREALADEREALANERDGQASLRGKRLDERERDLDDLQLRLARTLERTRALLAAERLRRDPLQVGGADPAARAQGGLAEAGEDLAASERLAARLIGIRQQVERSKRLRRQAAAMIDALAATEERIARQHDQLATVSARHAGRYRRLADDARAAAQRARAIMHDQH